MANVNGTKHVELLAPAGNLACALAAFDAGADAVYAGLKRFNARERTENFSAGDMSKLIAYANKNGKHVYVTFNTLIKESELDDAAAELAELELLRPSAVIVQDIGIVRLMREYFPALTIHASTQMGLHNSRGLAFARELGISRVILERQTTLDEVDAMAKAAPEGIELEVFVHGALCTCISGSCLLSSWLGSWSGNRGKCKQPCRRRYHSSSGNGFFLSAQDLCTIELMPRLMQSGVASLKIEGRLRRADYVANVVSAYRLAMDNAHDPERFRDALPRAKELLTKTCGRKWSDGFYTENSRRELIKFDALGASGQLCGNVTGTAKNGFTIAATRRLHVGDVIRIQPRSGDEGPSVTITKMSVDNHPASRVLKGGTAFIHSDKPVTTGSLVYKTGESVPDFSRRIAAMPLRKMPFDMQIELDLTHIAVTIPGGKWEKSLELAVASGHPANAETLQNEFSAVSTETLSAANIKAKVQGAPFLPASVLKKIRREFTEWLDEHFSAEDLRADNLRRLEQFRADHHAMNAPDLSAGKWRNAAIVPRGRKAPQDAVIVREIKEKPSPHEELMLPFFVREKDIAAVKKAIADFADGGGKTVRITSLHHFAFLKDHPDLQIKTCMPLPVCNALAAQELQRLGASMAQGWIELGKNELEELAKRSPLPLELYRYGRPILFSTHAKIPAEGTLTDARGNEFHIVRDGALTQLTADKIMSLPPVRGFACELSDLQHADGCGKAGRAVFNFECGLN